jgi:sigma-B regulation protein RsbU (phosphoserine phosphatase)
MLLNISDLSAEPPHAQLARQLVAGILAGDMAPGVSLLPPRQIARQQRISVATVERAYRELARQGILVQRSDGGFTVDSPSPERRRTHAIRQLLSDGTARRHLADDLARAQAEQDALLPRDLPRDTQLEIAASTVASRVVSGDFYDCTPLGGSRVALAIGDAVGKGLPAALVAAQVQALWKAGIARGIASTLGALNLHLAALGARRCVTLFCGVYDRASGALEYASAGHNPPLLARADGSCEVLDAGGMLLGAFPEAEYPTAAITLERGDALLLYTDGVTEAWSGSGEIYGEGRLEDVFVRGRAASAAEVVRAIEADVSAFRSSAFPQDDLTIMVLKRVGGGDPCC